VLTPREQDVLALIRGGLTNEQIAERLGIGFETAKSHVAEILSKLGVATREEAAAWQPEPERRWSLGRIVFALAGTTVVAAAVAGLALLAWGLSRAGGGGQIVEATGTPSAAASVPSPSPTTGLIEGPNVSVRAFWMSDSSNGWMGGASRGCKEPGSPCVGVIFHTSNGGQSWDEQYSGDVQVSALAFGGQELGFAIGTTGTCDSRTSACPSRVLRTTDGGLHWNEVTTTPYQLTTLSVTPGDAWAIGEGCPSAQSPCAGNLHLLTSADSGGTWDTSLLPISAFATDLSRPTANDAWIVTSPAGPGTAQIIVTHDAGQTWQVLPGPSQGLSFEQRIFFLSPAEGWLLVGSEPGAGSQPKELFSTNDGGQTWVHLTGSLGFGTGGVPTSSPGQGISIGGYVGPVVFTSDLEGWIASPRAGLLHTSDGGSNWSLGLMDDNLQTAHFIDAEHGWALDFINFWSTSNGGDRKSVV
jgi:Response regulator containing a CheY-like receiver domain and an HTH DNA-binding domain